MPKIEGALEALALNDKGGQSAIGWAKNPASRYVPVVDLFAGDVLLVSGRAGALRAIEPGGVLAPCGFSLELPPNFCCGETLSLVATIRTKGGAVEIGRLDARRPPFGEMLADGPPLRLPIHPPATDTAPVRAAAIVLTQDGASILRNLLETIARFEPSGFTSIVVVDHESTDDTEAVVEAFADRLPVRLLRRPRLSSFSESNNLAAAKCDEDVLVFVNNDVLLTAPIVAALAAHLTADAGLVGLRLIDPPAADPAAAQAQQHVGVHFCPTPSGLRPFESRRLTDAPEAETEAIAVPAVTAALVAMRRKTFQALGGFDERYFFGWEDVDLCLRALASGLTNVCVNSAAAIHLGAHTRKRMQADLKARRAENETRFAERWSSALRKSFEMEQFAKPGMWTGRKLHIGLLGDPVDAAFAAALASTMPARVFRLGPEGDAWDIDLIVTRDPLVDVRALSHAGSTACLVAWADASEGWAIAPWREHFDLWLCEDATTAEALSKQLGRVVVALDVDDPLPDASRPHPSGQARGSRERSAELAARTLVRTLRERTSGRRG